MAGIAMPDCGGKAGLDHTLDEVRNIFLEEEDLQESQLFMPQLWKNCSSHGYAMKE